MTHLLSTKTDNTVETAQQWITYTDRRVRPKYKDTESRKHY